MMYSFARRTSDARIAIAGVDAQYPLYGPDLTNHVQYVGYRGPRGSFDRAKSCAEWRRLINEGDYDFVVTSGKTARTDEPVEAMWTRSDRAAKAIQHAGSATIFRIDGLLDAEACSARS